MRWTCGIACLLCAAAHADVALTFVSAVELPASAIDQHGAPFTVTGLSGITRLPDGRYACVMDNSDKILLLSITLTPDGAIAAAAITGGVTLSASRDTEDLAPIDANHAMLADESADARLRLADLVTGVVLDGPNLPGVFTNVRPNFGIESLCRAGDGSYWFCNEESLTVDGPPSSPTAGTIVRIQRLTADLVASRQFAYRTDPMHGSIVSGARSGISALVSAPPDGPLLALERSFAFNLAGLFRTRIYEVNHGDATDTLGAPAVAAPPVVTASKRLLYDGNQNNLEGLCVGPKLGVGTYALLGITDDADPVSTNRLVSFRLAGVPCGVADLGVQGATAGSDGLLDNNDFIVFVNHFFAADPRADIGGQGGVRGTDRAFDNNDFVVFVDRFFAGCG